MNGRPAVVVAIPAHDEGSSIARTVYSVRDALRWASRRRVISSSSIQVVAHRCSDHTAEEARVALGHDGVGIVVQDELSSSIGQVRDHAARRGLATLSSSAEATWILSTDADTVVPRRWVVEIVRAARRYDVRAVVGLAELDRFRGSRHAETAYAGILQRGFVPGGGSLHQHNHVYGANLAVRADAYWEAGGFPHLPHGEDTRLVEALVERDVPVLRTCDVIVTTSGRLHGRATDGLADLLRGLDAPAHVSA